MHKSHSDPSRTTALGMIRYATEFYAAAVAADDELGEETGHEAVAPIPVNYLMGHAIELGLKAYLLNTGMLPTQIRAKFNHNLEKALDAAEGAGLDKLISLSAEDRSVLRVLNELYADKQFEYIETGLKTFPVFGPLQSLAHRLLMTVIKAIPDSKPLLRRKAGEILQRSITLS